MLQLTAELTMAMLWCEYPLGSSLLLQCKEDIRKPREYLNSDRDGV